jgi:hypothetical protein
MAGIFTQILQQMTLPDKNIKWCEQVDFLLDPRTITNLFDSI